MSHENIRLIPRIIGRFPGEERGVCVECGETFPLREMGLVASTSHDHRIMLGFDLYCYDCFYDMSDGDIEAWTEAENCFVKVESLGPHSSEDNTPVHSDYRLYYKEVGN